MAKVGLPDATVALARGASMNVGALGAPPRRAGDSPSSGCRNARIIHSSTQVLMQECTVVIPIWPLQLKK